MDAASALKKIDELDKFGINLGLGRISACLAALGDPQKRYPTLHVGGTNGKGSTSAFTAEILRAAGFRTGLYTSPPLNRFGERMRVDGEVMPDSLVPGLYGRVMEASGREAACAGMTQFEVITAMAFLYFAEIGVDVAVIEVGMGGRLDSTNVIEPLAAAVTNVGLEHSAHLGPTVEAIAAEKAGIGKSGRPFITTATEPALKVLRERAISIGAPFKALGEDFHMEGEGEYVFTGARMRVEGIRIGLPGPFQRLNLAASLAMIEELAAAGWPITAEHMRSGALNARWPGRLELFGDSPRVLIDGAHNPHAAFALAEALDRGFPRGKLILVLGILDDKDAESIMGILAPLADRVILTRSASRRAFGPDELKARAAEAMPGAYAAKDVGEALKMAGNLASGEDLIVVTGSLTLIGEARAILAGGDL